MKRTDIKRKAPLQRGTSTLKTTKPLVAKSAMARGTSTLARPTTPMAAVGARGKRTRQGKVAPNSAEQAWMDAIAGFGCIVCLQQSGVATQAEVHHLKQGDRRMGHLFSIPLCYWHHRGGDKDGPYISRHPWKARFEAAYGSELTLLEELRVLLAQQQK